MGEKNQTMVIRLYQGDHEGGNPRGQAGADPGGLAAVVADSGQRRSRHYPTPLSLQALAKDDQGQIPKKTVSVFRMVECSGPEEPS